jgi:Ca-activated chloride channel family protein
MSVRGLIAAFALIVGASFDPVITVARVPAPGATITGSVVDARLEPIAGASVTLTTGLTVAARTTSGADGVFVFAGVQPGRYVVRAARTGYPAIAKPISVSPGAKSLKLPLVMPRPQDELAPAPVEAATVAAGTPVIAAPPPPPAPPASAKPAVMTSRGVATSAADAIGRMPQRDAWHIVPEAEKYAPIHANQFVKTSEQAVSTFGADVDTASYTNVRRMLSAGQMPPRDAVRIEELVNYFRFAYPAPDGREPIGITTEVGDCPWAPGHKLVLIGARAADAVRQDYEGRNIVLLLDVSGSMAPPERLPLIKTALGMFADTLGDGDTLSIVTYAGSSGVELPPTPARRRHDIHAAIDRLHAGGSTNGAQGLITAYRLAREAFIPGGVNRVVLATDGDFNVGVTSDGGLFRLVTRERESGVFLSVLGVGRGNLNDRTMQVLANNGNGNYAYIDSLQEARRVLVLEGDGVINTIAKDVKFQVTFDPRIVASWKQLGYEKRQLAAKDFEDDRKDAGEMGAGQTVTVLYEVVPAKGRQSSLANGFSVEARYKRPDDDASARVVAAPRREAVPRFLPLASMIAEYGLLLRDAPRDEARWAALAQRLAALPVDDGNPATFRRDFLELVELARALAVR